jgi:dTDP-4-amino-4,6-dideoxygalactose transaminase
MSEVPFVDLAAEHGPLGEQLGAAIDATLQRGDFILGADLERFETEYAAFVGCEHGIGVGSGTAALEIAIRALGIGSGDRVIVPAHTYIASALGVVHAGAEPLFCDVDPRTGLVDLDSAAAVLDDRTAGLLPVHLYGQCADLDALAGFADRHGIALIEDAAQAHGARWGGRPAGSVGRAGCFSFYPSKNLGGLGDGGMITTNDAEIAATARRLRHLGQRGKGEHVEVGFNERLDTIQAAALRVKLPHLERWNETRRRAADTYRAALAERVPTLPDREAAEDVFHLFPVRLGDRDRIRERLSAAGIGTGIHYSPAVHRQPPFAELATAGSLPEAEAWAAEELSLPIYAGIETAQADRVASALLEALREG